MARWLKKTSGLAVLAFLAGILVVVVPLNSRPQERKFGTLSNQQVIEMLDTIEVDIKKHYYDPSMRGLPLDQRFDKARAQNKLAKSEVEALLDVAAAVAFLNDSHTRLFLPCGRMAWIMDGRSRPLGTPNAL
jgi:hypothetical protein